MAYGNCVCIVHILVRIKRVNACLSHDVLLQSYVRFATTGCAEKLLEAAAVLEEKLTGVSFVAVSGKCMHGPRAVRLLR